MGFDGLRVVAFESRRARELAELVRRHGGDPFSAPALREVADVDREALAGFGRDLRAGRVDVVVFLTGVGTRALVAALADELPAAEFAERLSGIVTVARGPKPLAALRELGVTPTVAVPEPNTWRELLAALDARVSLRGKTVVVQEYGERNPELLAALEARGATVRPLPVYRWALPEELGPLREAVRRLCAAEVDVALFTSASQVDHLLEVARGREAELVSSFSRVVVASIGPICSERLRRAGIDVDLEPQPPKMGPLVLAAAERSAEILRRKRAEAGPLTPRRPP
jgi:uroporphyrinogen-III synthase